VTNGEIILRTGYRTLIIMVHCMFQLQISDCFIFRRNLLFVFLLRRKQFEHPMLPVLGLLRNQEPCSNVTYDKTLYFLSPIFTTCVLFLENSIITQLVNKFLASVERAVSS
jgi:hypothetical protein